MKRRMMAWVLLLALGSVACAGGSRVGDESLLEGIDPNKGSNRLGKIENSPTAKPSQGKKKAEPVDPEPSKAPEPVTKVWPVSITAEGFDPFNFRVFKGDKIKVTNDDAAARSFKAIDGSFDSGLLDPGESWTYVAKKVGVYELEDATRPFVVGKLEVIARA